MYKLAITGKTFSVENHFSSSIEAWEYITCFKKTYEITSYSITKVAA